MFKEVRYPANHIRQNDPRKELRNQHFTNSYVLIKFHRSELSSSFPAGDEEDHDDSFLSLLGRIECSISIGRRHCSGLLYNPNQVQDILIGAATTPRFKLQTDLGYVLEFRGKVLLE